MKRILDNIKKTLNPTPEAFDALSKAMEIVTLDKNDYFLKAGQICSSVGFIEKGSMRLFQSSPEKEVCSDFFFENSFIGSFASFLSQQPSLVNICAIEPCELLVMHFDDVMRLTKEHPSLRRLADIIVQEQFLRAEKREAALLLHSPEERFRKILEEHPKLFKRIPLHYVASYLAITPETLSRYRNKLV
ncbi:Crp/Fnr family transcriptional regulator [Flavobacterium sp.]|uniref:Crp/Fnr family transcriptional regulator n=1 Tax=Flavobacterium sp. TaxID=239 RepID=UPI0039E34C20